MEHHIAEHQRCLCGGLIQDGGLNFGWEFPGILMHAWFLDGIDGDGRFLVDDMIIYHHGRFFLTRASSLKDKLLHAAHEDFLAVHFDAYFSLLEEFTWEGIQKDMYHELCLDIYMGDPGEFLEKTQESLYVEKDLLFPLHEVLDQL